MDTEKVDEISSLPDEIVAKILSFLPIKRAACTSLISKRWRDLFPLMIQLFESQYDNIYLDESDLLYPVNEGKRERKDVQESFGSFVEKTLSSFSSIKKLTLKCPLSCVAHTETDQWLLLALERGIVDLDLHFKMGFSSWENWWPYSAFINKNKTLVKLTLRIEYGGHELYHFPRACLLPVLKSLSLHTVWQISQFTLEELLRGCPILEELSFNYLCGDPVFQNLILRVHHETLKRLTFDDGNSHPRCYHHFMQFNTPSLVYLDYSGCLLVDHTPYSSRPLDSLVEAKLDLRPSTSDYLSRNLSPIIIFMGTVKTLSLSSAFVKEMYSTSMQIPLFLNLVTLYFESDTEQGWEVMLRRLLNQSPKLDTLVLTGLHGVGNQGISIDQNEVNVLEIHGFSGSGGELKLVKCFFRQMQFLQVMRVRIDADDNNMKLQLTNQLLDLRNRHSFKCQILFL